MKKTFSWAIAVCIGLFAMLVLTGASSTTTITNVVNNGGSPTTYTLTVTSTTSMVVSDLLVANTAAGTSGLWRISSITDSVTCVVTDDETIGNSGSEWGSPIPGSAAWETPTVNNRLVQLPQGSRHWWAAWRHNFAQMDVSLDGDITSVTADDGLSGGGITGAVEIDVDVTEIVGAGLEADSSSPKNIRIASTAAGNGLQGGSGSALSVKADTLTGGTIAEVTVSSSGVGVDVEDLDGDKVVIDYEPTQYTPNTGIADVDSENHLSAHLNGINSALAAVSSGGDITEVNTTAPLAGGATSGAVNLTISGITAAELATDSVDSDEIASGAVGVAEIATDAVTSAKIADGTITVDDIGADAVGETQIADNSVGQAEIKDNSIALPKLGFSGEDLPVVDSTTNYTAAAATLQAHLNGIDTALGAAAGGDVTDVIGGDGLTDDGNTGDITLDIAVADFAGTGLESDGGSPANLRLAAQGNGIGGGGGSTLTVTPDVTTGGDTAPVTVAANGVGVDVTTLDGDHLDVDWTPSNYVPDSSPSEAADVDDLTAHIAGIDSQLFVSQDPSTFQARLSLSSSDPAPTGDNTGTVVYLLPYKGDYVALYSGTRWELFDIGAGYVLSNSGLSVDTNYDVFLDSTSGLTATAWSTDTARATALTTQDGVYVLTGDATKRYVGTVRTTASGGFADTGAAEPAERFTWNYYNRLPYSDFRPDDTDSWTDAGNLTYSATNGGDNAWVYGIVTGVVEQPVSALATIEVDGNYAFAFAVDSTTTVSADSSIAFHGDTSSPITISAQYAGTPGLGFRTLRLLETTSTAATETAYGDAGGTAILAGMRVQGWK